MAYLRCFIIKTVLKPKLNNGNFALCKIGNYYMRICELKIRDMRTGSH